MYLYGDTFIRIRESTQLSFEISHLEFVDLLHACPRKLCNNGAENSGVIEVAIREKALTTTILSILVS